MAPSRNLHPTLVIYQPRTEMFVAILLALLFSGLGTLFAWVFLLGSENDANLVFRVPFIGVGAAMACFGVLITLRLIMALIRRPRLILDHKGIRVETLWRSQEHEWTRIGRFKNGEFSERKVLFFETDATRPVENGMKRSEIMSRICIVPFTGYYSESEFSAMVGYYSGRISAWDYAR